MRTGVDLGQQETPLSNSLPQAGERTNVKGNLQISGLYTQLMERATGLPNDELFAQMICSQVGGACALPPCLGLEEADFAALLTRHFPRMQIVVRGQRDSDDGRAPERDDVLALLLEHRAGRDESESWMAEIVTAACMANDHLWQDLGLWSRKYLSQLMTQNFPALAAKNSKDMKWKKFLYKQLCEKEEIRICRAPSCEVCADYQKCFGPEE
ncbi:MAG: nitrogen fixation protein NifQ [Nitrosomonadales bacterium]|nr:nitrogen fixation protein NifQ [Nitrosomonadales bacterium]